MPTRKKAAPSRDRSGHYKLPDGQALMSVTTVLSNGIPKPNLIHWAAREVAASAVENAPAIARMRGEAQRKEMFDFLRRAAETKRDKAAELGSAVHAAVESIVLGEPQKDVSAEQLPYVAAFHRFVEDWSPEWEATELVVANPADGWAGTLDWIARVPGLGSGLVLGDWKTGKGVYAEAALQLSAYRRATVGWLRDGTSVDIPETERAVVVHLRPDKWQDTGYRVVPLDTGNDVYDLFRGAQEIAKYKKRSETLLGEPMAAPEAA